MTSGAPCGGCTRAATVRAGSRVGGSGSMGSLDQIVAHRSPGSPGRSGCPVLAAEYPGPGETELWVSVRTHTSASMRSSQPTILALRAVSFGSTRARFHVAIFMLIGSRPTERSSAPRRLRATLVVVSDPEPHIARPDPDRRARLNQRLRQAFIERAEEDSRRLLGRGLTAEELERVLRVGRGPTPGSEGRQQLGLLGLELLA